MRHSTFIYAQTGFGRFPKTNLKLPALTKAGNFTVVQTFSLVSFKSDIWNFFALYNICKSRVFSSFFSKPVRNCLSVKKSAMMHSLASFAGQKRQNNKRGKLCLRSRCHFLCYFLFDKRKSRRRPTVSSRTMKLKSDISIVRFLKKVYNYIKQKDSKCL